MDANQLERQLLDIFTWLCPEDLINASHVCRAWRSAVFESTHLWTSFKVPENWSVSFLRTFIPMASTLEVKSSTMKRIHDSGIKCFGSVVQMKILNSHVYHPSASDHDILEICSLLTRECAPHLRRLCVSCVKHPIFAIGSIPTETAIESLCNLDGEIELCLAATTADARVPDAVSFDRVGNVVNEVARVILCSAGSQWAMSEALSIMKDNRSMFRRKQQCAQEYLISKYFLHSTTPTELPSITAQKIISTLDEGRCVNSLATETERRP